MAVVMVVVVQGWGKSHDRTHLRRVASRRGSGLVGVCRSSIRVTEEVYVAAGGFSEPGERPSSSA